MRVLQITAYSGWGCTGRITVGIHNALVADGHESKIAWGRNNTAPENIPTIKIGNKIDQQMHGLYTRITDKCGFGSKCVTKEFLKQIDDYKPDLIQLHILHGYYINLELLFSYIRERNIPTVWTFHDCWAFTGHCPYFDLVGCEKWKTGCHDCQQKNHHPRSWLIDNSKWNWGKKRELFSNIEQLTIVTPSAWLAGLVKQSYLQKCRIEVINNGINTDDFKPTYGNMISKLHIQNKKIVLGVSSTWVKSKGIDDFVKLSKLLTKEYVIVLVGLTEKQKKELPEGIVGIGRTDSVEELAELYTAAAVFVNPTYEDNYPTTNLEALACGTPVVTYNTGGSAESVLLSKNGSIVDQGNIVALCEAITNSKKSGEIVLGNLVLDQNQNFRRYVKLYNEILEK